jgi:hypothetical protein
LLFVFKKSLFPFVSAGTGSANAVDIQAEVEAVESGVTTETHELDKFRIISLLDFATLLTNEMQMISRAYFTFILGGLRAELMLTDDATINKKLYGVVNRSPADMETFRLDGFIQSLDVKVSVEITHFVQYGKPFGRFSHALIPKIFGEGGLGD